MLPTAGHSCSVLSSSSIIQLITFQYSTRHLNSHKTTRRCNIKPKRKSQRSSKILPKADTMAPENARLFLHDHPMSSYAVKVRMALRQKASPSTLQPQQD